MPRRYYLYAIIAVAVGVVLALWLRSRQRAATQAAQAAYLRDKYKGSSGNAERALVEWRTAVPTTAPPEDRTKLHLDSTIYELMS